MSYPDIVLSRQTLLTCLETILTIILLFFSQERTGYGLGKFQSSEDVAKARGAAPWTRALPISHGKSAGLLRAGPTWWLYELIKGAGAQSEAHLRGPRGGRGWECLAKWRVSREVESVLRSGECLEKWRVPREVESASRSGECLEKWKVSRDPDCRLRSPTVAFNTAWS